MTRDLEVTTAPVDVVRALNLVEGVDYSIEVVLGAPSVRFRENAAAPRDRSYFHVLTPGQIKVIQPVAGQGIWLWVAADKARIVVTEAE